MHVLLCQVLISSVQPLDFYGHTAVDVTGAFLYFSYSVFFQELQFLDLTDADEEECDFLQATLFRWNPNVTYPELPWTTQADVSSTPAEWRPTPCGKYL